MSPYRRPSNRNAIRLVYIIAFLIVLTVLLAGLSGCDRLRFSPTEPQRQIAYQTHQNALVANAQGAEPASPLTHQLVDGTATSLAYTGMPADPCISNYELTAAQARSDARQRPTAADVTDEAFTAAEGGLDFVSDILPILGLGGVGVAGKTLIDWIRLARQKSTALREVVAGSELFKHELRKAGSGFTAEQAQQIIEIFGLAQNSAQSGVATKTLVTANKTA